MADERKIAIPKPDPETKPFWDAAARGTLLLKRCRACGKAHYFPRPLCPFCMSEETEWIEASGKGEIYSFSVMRRAAPPYAIAYVTLGGRGHGDDQHRRLRFRRAANRHARRARLPAERWRRGRADIQARVRKDPAEAGLLATTVRARSRRC